MMQSSSAARRLRAWLGRAIATVALTTTLTACDRHPTSPHPPTTSETITVASLVPAASDLILGMNAAVRLVAVSNYDVPDDRTKDLPRVGDYQNIDWEKLAGISPSVMVVQYDKDRVPPGLTQRAQAMGISVVNTSNDTLGEIFSTLTQLGAAMKMERQASDAVDRLRKQLDAVAAGVKGKPVVRTLIVLDDDGQSVVGGDTFLGDVLAIAGGVNVLADADKRYLQIDAERLSALKPDVILQLRPGATPQELERGKLAMARHTDVSAVKNGRVYVMTEQWVLLPGYRVGDLAEKFAAALHGGPTTRATQLEGVTQ
jgi:iron complex transport system substrate-binding protein